MHMMHMIKEESQKPHRVVVRFCAGYDCKNTVTTHRVRQNIDGYRAYCSLLCYHRWSPAMRQVILQHPEYESSPRGLEKLILDLRREYGMNDASQVLGFSRSTVASWLRKLEAFRQFAGQEPEAVLALLADVAKSRGVDEAAKLILIDPKTLDQALSRRAQMQDQMKKAA